MILKKAYITKWLIESWRNEVYEKLLSSLVGHRSLISSCSNHDEVAVGTQIVSTDSTKG